MKRHEPSEWEALVRIWREVSPQPLPPADLRRRIMEAVDEKPSRNETPLVGLALAATVALVAVLAGVVHWPGQAPRDDVPGQQLLVMEPMQTVDPYDLEIDRDTPCGRADQCLAPGMDIMPLDAHGERIL